MCFTMCAIQMGKSWQEISDFDIEYTVAIFLHSQHQRQYFPGENSDQHVKTDIYLVATGVGRRKTVGSERGYRPKWKRNIGEHPPYFHGA